MRTFRQDNEQKMRDFAKLEAAKFSRHEIALMIQVGTSTLTRWEYYPDFMTDLYRAGGTFSKIRCTFETYAVRMALGKTDTQALINLLGAEKETKHWEERFAKWNASTHFKRRLEEYKDTKPQEVAAAERLWIQRILEVLASHGDGFSKERSAFELYAIRLAQGKDDLKGIIKLLAYDLAAHKQKKEKWQEKFADRKQVNLQARLEMYNDWEIQQKAEAEKRWLQRIRHPKKTPSLNEEIVIVTEIQVRYALRHILQKLHTVKDIEAFCVSIETEEKAIPEAIRLVINDAAAVCKIRTFKLTRMLRDTAKTVVSELTKSQE